MNPKNFVPQLLVFLAVAFPVVAADPAPPDGRVISADSMSYWVFSDIFEAAGPRFTPFHGGFGLLNYQDICKPAFFSTSF